MTALPALKYEQPEPATVERGTFRAWLEEEFRDRGCHAARGNTDIYDVAEFCRKYGFRRSTITGYMRAARPNTPSLRMCREIATMLDLTAVEVIAAAGHITFAELDDYNHACANEDTDNWATTGDL